MSIINQMLQDLEQRRADDKPAQPTLLEVRAVATEKPKKPWLLSLSAITGITVVAYVLLSPTVKQFNLLNNTVFSEAEAKSPPSAEATSPTVVEKTTVAPVALAPEIATNSATPVDPTPSVAPNGEPSNNGLSTALSEISIARLTHAEAQATKVLKNDVSKVSLSDTKLTATAEKKPQIAEPPSAPTAVAHNTSTPMATTSVETAAPVQVATMSHQAISKKMSPAQKLLNDYKQAIQYLQMGRVAESEALLSTILEAKPDHQDGRQTLASLLLDSNRNNEAMTLLKAGLDINPAQTDFRLPLARLELELVGNEKALKTLEDGAPFAQNNAEYHSFYATLLQRSNRHQEAVEQYSKALASNPNMPSSLIGLGISLQSLSRLDEAKEAYERAQNNKLSPELAQFVAQRIKQIKQL